MFEAADPQLLEAIATGAAVAIPLASERVLKKGVTPSLKKDGTPTAGIACLLLSFFCRRYRYKR